MQLKNKNNALVKGGSIEWNVNTYMIMPPSLRCIICLAWTNLCVNKKNVLTKSFLEF